MKSNKSLPTLESSRLCLRQLQLSDTEDLFAILSDPKTMRYWSHGPLKEMAEAQAYLRNINAGRVRISVIVTARFG